MILYKPDSIMLDLEDAVAENQKDVARFSLYHALKTINYRGCERVVRINGLDTPYWREDIRASVAGGCDAIRIPKTESPKDVQIVEAAIAEDEKTYGRPEGEVLIIAALESARGIMRALDICESSERLFGIALSGGDYTKDLQTHITGTGVELMGARQNMIIAARAAGVQCFDTVYTDLKNMEGFREDVENGSGDISRRIRLSTWTKGQSPYAIIVTCSDSRVIPENIFSAGIGELFVIRLAGNIIDDHQLGSIEYAAGHLGCRLVVVLGHTHCGAVDAAIHHQPDGYIKYITDEIKQAIGEETDPYKASCLNVRHSVREIEKSLCIHHIEEETGLRVVGAMYHIEDGSVEFL